MNKKTCKTCKEEFDLSNFYWNKTRDRYSSYCIPCEKKKKKEKRDEQKDLDQFGIV